MPAANLTAGVIEYLDSGGDDRPVLVMFSGLFVGVSMWRHVVAELGDEFRCVIPQLPLGAHHTPMRSGADLSGRGLARLLAEFMERLGLENVTLVGSDWGGAQLMVAEGVDTRVARLVLLPQEAFDNYPPGFAGRSVCLAARIPGGLTLALQQMRIRLMRRSALTFGRMSKRPIPDDVLDSWLAPALHRPEIRKDVESYLRATVTGDYLRAAEALTRFDRPALVIWATEDKLMPVAHGRRLADILPNGRLVEIADSYTLIPEDQPAACAAAIRDFVRSTFRVRP
ncbi:alpha/beta fold hydrolase [Pilimelia columellifera]|uniref:Alpha/beta hydrolase n=1 Tax=Pilimelia columellifera subsp. columellifera TaxID=706583 RepID=A0ABN3NDX7_9ACTN